MKNIIAGLLILFGAIWSCFAATTVFPAATNAPNVFFGTNLFRTNAAFQGFVQIGTNLIQNQGSKINGVGFTNSVMSGTMHFIGDTAVSVITGDGNLFYGAPLLAFYFDKDVHAPSFQATNATGGFVGDGSLITGLDAANVTGTLSLAQINAGTIVVTNAMAVNLYGSTNYQIPIGQKLTNAVNYGSAVGTNASWIDASGNMVCSNANGTVRAAGGLVTAYAWTTQTNSWALDTPIPWGTNRLVLVSGAATGGIVGISGFPASGGTVELFVKATGDIVFTNLATIIAASDFVSSRTITNGNKACIAIDLVPNQMTNLAIVQFR